MLEIIASHPHIAYLLILLISLLESLAIVGLVFPGTMIMLGVGVIVSTGALSLKPVIIAAIIGSIAGDGISYWIGRIYHQRLKCFWPFNRHPQILPRGEQFFNEHGGKSVLFGRFIGPMRPVIPIVAGMLGMTPLRFTLVNVASGIAWAFAYTLPGVLFGTSLALAGNISSRLSILILLTVAIIWAFVWICHHLINLIINHGPQKLASLENWIVADDPAPKAIYYVKRLLSWFLSRQKGEEYLLIFLALLLFLTGWGFIGVLKDVVMRDQLVQADQAIYHFLQSLRNPWGDSIFIAITELGDGLVNVAMGLAVFIILMIFRCYRTARYWLVSLIGGAGLYLFTKWLLHLQRPTALSQGISAYGFPSGHTAMSVVLYGTLALLVAKGLRNNTIKWSLFAALFLISFVIAFSRLYLGVHWFSDVLGGFLLASFWTALTGIVYMKGHSEVVPRRLLAFTTLIVLIAAGSWNIAGHHSKDLVLYSQHHKIEVMDADTWMTRGWEKLPAWRTDLKGEREQPLTFQWVGSLDQLAQYLVSQGWEIPPEPDTKILLSMLSPETKVQDLPLFPHLHDGRFENLILVRDVGSDRLVLRIWPTDVRLKNSKSSFWVGTVEVQRKKRLADLITITKDKGDYDRPLETLLKPLKDRGWLRKVAYRKADRVPAKDPSGGATRYSRVILAMGPGGV
jgi:membrane protein DedA with SNARE-associated domain/membrane-associated phospholipid phosphatase